MSEEKLIGFCVAPHCLYCENFNDCLKNDSFVYVRKDWFYGRTVDPAYYCGSFNLDKFCIVR